jgi:hypothetical protein
VPGEGNTLTRRSEALETFEVFDAGQVLEDLAPDVILQGALDTPILNAIGFDGPTPTSMYHKWTNDDYDVLELTLGEDLDAVETDVTIAASGLQVEEGSIIEIGTEYMIVTESDSNTLLEVLRAQCGTSATTHSNGAAIRVIGQATYDSTLFPKAKMGTRTPTGNYLQQMVIPIEVSDIADAIRNVGTNSELAFQKKKKLPKAMALLERSFLQGAAQSTPQGDATTAATMDGVRAIISTNSTAAGSVRLTEATFRATAKKCDDYGGQPDMAFVNRFQGDVIDTWNEGRTRLDPTEDAVGKEVIQYLKCPYARNGRLRIIRSRHMKADEVYIVDSSKLTLAPLRTFRTVAYSKIGTSTRIAIWGVYTMELKGEKHCAKITGLATS